MNSVKDWSAIRLHFEAMPGVAYLNTGTHGRTPKRTLEVADEWRNRIAAEPCEIVWRRLPEALWPARVRLAEFVNAPPETVIFMANVTAGINTVTNGIRLEAGRDILLTDQEYGAMTFAWQRAAERSGANLRSIQLPCGPAFSRDAVIEQFDAEINSKTQVVFFSHVSTATGLVLPVQEICRIARQRGALSVVDGAHAPGMIPVQIDAMDCDFYAANGHKWLLAPTGSGFLYVRPDVADRLEPLVVSWGWKYDGAKAHARDNDGSTPFIRSHEFQGTRDPAPWLAMPSAIDYQQSLGTDSIQARNRELASYCRERLSKISGVVPTIPDDPQLAAALVAYRLPRGEAVPTQRALWDRFKIETPVLDRAGGPYLRVSTHFYNTHDEIDRLYAALGEILE